MEINPIPEQKLLHDLFNYKEGKLFWKDRVGVPSWWNTRYSGKRAGSVTLKGCRQILINKKPFMEHRLIWGYFFGDIPQGVQVGHKDSDKLNNFIDNLDLYPNTVQVLAKDSKYRRKAKVKTRGVWLVGSRYRVEIQFKGKRYYCGYWPNLDEAKSAYKNKKKQLRNKHHD